jgi:hypothetical protein
VSCSVFVEGGGDTKYLRKRCREGFTAFFVKAGLAGRMPAIVACGSRGDAYSTFCTALKNAHARAFPVLLVDSEAPVVQGKTPWAHVHDRDGWPKPPEAVDEQLHLMVQCMESWFVADRQAVAIFFAKGFKAKALPQNKKVEEIPVQTVQDALKAASKDTKKGRYDKGTHAFGILATIDPQKVAAAATHARRLLDTLKINL